MPKDAKLIMIVPHTRGTAAEASDLLEIIHVDVWGPMSVETRSGYRYFLTFTDDLSRYGDTYLMKHKSEMFEKFKQFQSEVEDHRDKKIKCLRYDHGGEYLSYEFGMQLKTMWKLFHNSCRLEHQSVMVCPNVVVVLYWIWCVL
jgi:hypothetical protein